MRVGIEREEFAVDDRGGLGGRVAEGGAWPWLRGSRALFPAVFPFFAAFAFAVAVAVAAAAFAAAFAFAVTLVVTFATGP
ncbi:MAG: hypothetical protein IPG88_13745 [Gemmatimonadetes bacterium]|nr:hypothetical protein [Gemmatimonadota bacterium]